MVRQKAGHILGLIANGNGVDLHSALFQFQQDRRFGDAGQTPACKDVEKNGLAAL